eukprot:NODE_162_length_14959_cov_1.379610.p11 type:complete len:120 gc:universal NODE_162_length_14959_cov_1.379610:2766-3125(+)
MKDLNSICLKIKGFLSMSENVDQRSIYVGNVDFSVTSEELGLFFKSAGKVNRVTILTNQKGLPKGFAYVEFGDVEAVQKALLLNGEILSNRPLKVSTKRTNVPGRGRGRGRGRSRSRPY